MFDWVRAKPKPAPPPQVNERERKIYGYLWSETLARGLESRRDVRTRLKERVPEILRQEAHSPMQLAGELYGSCLRIVDHVPGVLAREMREHVFEAFSKEIAELDLKDKILNLLPLAVDRAVEKMRGDCVRYLVLCQPELVQAEVAWRRKFPGRAAQQPFQPPFWLTGPAQIALTVVVEDLVG